MRLVVDASVAVKWLVEEEYSDVADMLLDGRHELIAPRLMASEVGNALWRKVRMGEIERSHAGALAAAIPQMAVSWAEDEGVCPDAVRLPGAGPPGVRLRVSGVGAQDRCDVGDGGRPLCECAVGYGTRRRGGYA